MLQHLFMDFHFKYGFPLSQKYRDKYALSIDCAAYDADTGSFPAFLELTFSKSWEEFKHAGKTI